MKLKFTHVPTGRKVEFPAYLEMFSDAYTSQWNAEDVYGRMDQIATFINTRRAVSIAWNVPAYSYEYARFNLQNLNTLLSFLYPLYDSESGGATAINQSPLMRIEFGNLIRNADTGGGLLGYVNGFTFDPDLEGGMFYGKPRTGAVDYEYLPKTFRLNTEFNILHEHSLGFERINSKDPGSHFKFRNKNIKHYNYPYLSLPDAEAQRVSRQEASGRNSVTPGKSVSTPVPIQLNTEPPAKRNVTATPPLSPEVIEEVKKRETVRRSPVFQAIAQGLAGEERVVFNSRDTTEE